MKPTGLVRASTSATDSSSVSEAGSRCSRCASSTPQRARRGRQAGVLARAARSLRPDTTRDPRGSMQARASAAPACRLSGVGTGSHGEPSTLSRPRRYWEKRIFRVLHGSDREVSASSARVKVRLGLRATTMVTIAFQREVAVISAFSHRQFHVKLSHPQSVKRLKSPWRSPKPHMHLM